MWPGAGHILVQISTSEHSHLLEIVDCTDISIAVGPTALFHPHVQNVVCSTVRAVLEASTSGAFGCNYSCVTSSADQRQ
eukprot:scaffold479211_cov42-Prasinocladus_malaysianus.AAC.1